MRAEDEHVVEGDGGRQEQEHDEEQEGADVVRVVVPQLHQDLGHAPRVVLGEAERLLPRSPDVVSHDDRIRVGVGRAQGRVGTGARGACEEGQLD